MMADYTTALAAAFGLGVSVAAPIGPVSAAVIREGLEKGVKAAWLMGLGAAAVDFIYFGLVYAGVAPLILGVKPLVIGFNVAGGLLLTWLACGSLRSALRPAQDMPSAARPIGGGGFVYGFGITMLNPATILLWLGLGGAFASAYMAGMGLTAALGVVAAVGGGTAAWFGFVALLTGGVRRLFGGNPWILRAVNLAAGVALGSYAVHFLLRGISQGF